MNEQKSGLKLDVTGLSYESKEYEHRGSKFWIRRYPSSKGTWRMSGPAKDGDQPMLVFDGEEQWKRFSYCLTAWDCLDANGNPLACDEKTKRLVYDFNLEEIPAFVAKVAMLEGMEKERLEKN